MKVSKEFQLKILVVDDHAMTRNLVRSILRALGFTDILIAEDGRAAYRVMDEEGNIDLVVCDWNMPGGTGIDFLKMARSDPRFGSVPFIMLTAEAYEDKIQEAIASGVTDYIVKPFTAGVLTDKVKRALNLP